MLIRISEAYKRIETVMVDEQPIQKVFLYLNVEFVAGDICPLRQIKVEWPTTKQAVRDAIIAKKQELVAEFNAAQAMQQEDGTTKDAVKNLLNGVLEFEL